MIHTKEIVVDGVKYICSHFPTTQGLQLGSRFLGVVMPALADLIKDGLDKQVTGDLVSASIKTLLDCAGKEDLSGLMKDMLSTTEIQDESGRREINFDLDFSGRYQHLFQLIVQIAVFQGFFGEGAKDGKILSRMKSFVQAK